MNGNYLNDCRQLLQAFELSQADWLYLSTENAREEFLLEMEQLTGLLNDMAGALKDLPALSSRDLVLLSSQIDRMLKYIREFQSALHMLADQNQPVPKDLIFMFERQYRFKTILKNHLNDFARLL